MAYLEKIILQKDTRNISKLKEFLHKDFLDKAAKKISTKNGKVFIVTGFFISYANSPETDGPPGALAIGNALKQLGFEIIYITDKWSYSMMKGLLYAEDTLINFPVTSHEESDSFSKKLIEKYSPSIVISIERASLVEDGTYRNWKQEDVSEYNAKIDYLFKPSLYSIGIGDGGNEIGMGNLAEKIKSIKGLPDQPSVTKVDDLIISSCSNWGAFGLIAALSKIKKQNLLLSVDQVKQIIIKSVDLGAVEGLSGDKIYAVDGRGLKEDSECLNQLHNYLDEII
jgi:hypothetical protein